MLILVKDHSIAQEEAGALFPIELYEQLGAVSEAILAFMNRSDDDIPLSKEDQLPFNSADVKFALLSRSLLGVDELSTGNVKLTSSLKSFKRVHKLDDNHFRRYVRMKQQ